MIKRSRHLLVCCIAFFLLLLGFNSHASLSDSRQKDAWEKVTYDHGAIVEVGQSKLLWPVRLPTGLHSSGDKAFVTQEDSSRLKISICFHASDEAKVKRWAYGMPKDFPLPKGSYTFHKSAETMVNVTGPGHWTVGLEADTGVGKVELLFFGQPFDLKQAKDEIQTGEVGGGTSVTFLQQDNPMLHESRWVMFTIGLPAQKRGA